MSTLQTTQLTFTPWQGLQIWPAYVEVDFSVNGSKVCRGMVRDLPNLTTRRLTNLTTGTEFFADADTVFDHFVVTKFPVTDLDDMAVREVRDRLSVEAGRGSTSGDVDLLAKSVVEGVRIADINKALVV